MTRRLAEVNYPFCGCSAHLTRSAWRREHAMKRLALPLLRDDVLPYGRTWMIVPIGLSTYRQNHLRKRLISSLNMRCFL